jgi:hypothetical protein
MIDKASPHPAMKCGDHWHTFRDDKDPNFGKYPDGVTFYTEEDAIAATVAPTYKPFLAIGVCHDNEGFTFSRTIQHIQIGHTMKLWNYMCREANINLDEVILIQNDVIVKILPEGISNE